MSARNEDELMSAFGLLMQNHSEALVVGTDPFFNCRRKLIVDLAAQHAVPADGLAVPIEHLVLSGIEPRRRQLDEQIPSGGELRVP